MRGSPINNLNYGKEDSSNFKGTIRRASQKKDIYQTSPQRFNSNLNQVDYWKLRARKYEEQVINLNQELMFQNRKLLKIDQLEEKIEVLLRQSTHLVQQNQSLLKVIHQKKNEADSWKFKYESEFSNTNALESEARKVYDNLNTRDTQHKIQIDKLLSQISRLHDQIEQIQKLKQIQIDGLKSKYQAEAMNHIQNLKRSQQGNTQLYQLNIRKLRDALQQKGFQLQGLRKQNKLETQRLNGEISFLRNQLKKVEQQKQYEIQLIKAENENNINNLTRTHKKTQQQMKALYENKIRRMGYELEEKKNEIEECLTKIKKTGKQGQLQIVRLIEQKDKLRLQIKDNDVRHARQISDITNFFQNQLRVQKQNGDRKQQNLRILLQGQIDKLRRVIQNKQNQIQNLLQQIRILKENQQIKLNNIRNINQQLQNKLNQVITHYQRQIQLLKIKISSLYQADIQALRNLLTHQIQYLNSQNAKLKDTVTQTKDKLVSQIQEKILMRKDYQNRLNQMNIKFERQHQQLQDLLVMAQKNYDTVRSQTSVRDIQHASKLKRTNTSIQGIIGQKRTLQNHIKNKNKQIQELNLLIKKMAGYHAKQVNDLQNRLNEQQTRYKKWIQEQTKQARDSAAERQNLKEQNRRLNKAYKDEKSSLERKINDLLKDIENRRLRIAQLEGTVQQLTRQIGSLDSKVKVEIGNIQKTNLQLESMMNHEKERLQKVRESDKEGIRKDYDTRVAILKKQIADMATQIENLRNSYEEEKLKTRKLQTELRNVLNSVDDRSKLEEHVINIGLSNNYFKNVAEIFKKRIDG